MEPPSDASGRDGSPVRCLRAIGINEGGGGAAARGDVEWRRRGAAARRSQPCGFAEIINPSAVRAAAAAATAHGGGGAVAPAVAVPARASRLAPASAPRSRLGRRLLDAVRRIAPRTSTRLARAAGPIRSGRPEPPIDARVRTPNSTNRVGTGAADSDGVRVEPRAGSRGLNPHSAARA